MNTMDMAQFLERYRSLSRNIQNELQNAAKLVERLGANTQDSEKANQRIRESIESISTHWQDFNGWVLISTLEDLEEAKTNCALGIIEVESKIKRAKIKFSKEVSQKSVTIDISQASSKKIDTYIAYFEQLLDLVIGNAIKYSPPSSTIEIASAIKDRGIAISVSSIGPMVHQGEEIRLGEKGFRSETARKIAVTGQGYGLFNARRICQLLSGSITFRPSFKSIFSVQKIPYSNFEVLIYLPDEPS
ncbi:sensor histidine kinase [Pseudomonas lopnurensis]|uniref:sensor histidine kinase n=1 Tax=Pseudomonas lopnurensis TaxID=1477517 RepID=UPI00187AC3F0|nr:HAMP domain-containing sensor histidine kinase [Pseudomonas lopnurensis]MBE7374587.1 HAMP domain-containing histidine kinase [Pseudomonas lopnurensis]